MGPEQPGHSTEKNKIGEVLLEKISIFIKFKLIRQYDTSQGKILDCGRKQRSRAERIRSWNWKMCSCMP